MQKVRYTDSAIIFKNEFEMIINNFDILGNYVTKGDRNVIKKFTLSNGNVINIKKFKKPSFINSFIYKYIRTSKAERSFHFAEILLEKNIGTPTPMAFIERNSIFGLRDSYYISQHLEADYTFRDIIGNHTLPTYNKILKDFVKFCYHLHENEIEFLDHSPGNTLITTGEDGNSFYLVDLNRMKFGKLDIRQRMFNLRRLTPLKEMVEVISTEYARYVEYDKDTLFFILWGFTQKFQAKFHRKRKFKKKIKSIFKQSII